MSRASNLAGFTTSISPPANLSVGIITASSVINVGTGLTLSSGGINITGVITATSFSGNGSGLIGAGIGSTGSVNTSGIITATSFFGSGSGLTGVGLGTTGSINTSGIITASSFSGNGSGLTGVAATTLTIGAGTTALPSISPTGDSNTGIFFPSADTIAFAEGGAEAMRVDSSGRLLIGISTARSNYFSASAAPALQVEGSSTATSAISAIRNSADDNQSYVILAKSRSAAYGVVLSGDSIGEINFQAADGTNFVPAARITAAVDGTPGTNDMPGRLVFSTTADGAASPTERVRLDSSGRMLVGTSSSTDAKVVIANGSEQQVSFKIDNTNSSPVGVQIRYGTDINAAANRFIDCIGNATTRFLVFSNGNVQNTNNSYAGISDLKLKENIIVAGSQWDDIKALEVKKFNFIGDDKTQIGLIAQDVEQICPGLIEQSADTDDEGNETGEFTKSVKYSVLYMKAVKALQEAMERIEQLETNNIDLLARVIALETT